MLPLFCCNAVLLRKVNLQRCFYSPPGDVAAVWYIEIWNVNRMCQQFKNIIIVAVAVVLSSVSGLWIIIFFVDYFIVYNYNIVA